MSLSALDRLARLAAIVESSEDAIIGANTDGIITDWNKGAEQLYGYSADEVIGKPVSFLIPHDRPTEFAEIMGAIRRGESVAHYETVRHKKNGERLDISLSVSPIRDAAGRFLGAASIARDITQRKRQETVLRGSEERFRLLADTAPVLVWMSGTDKFCNYFNKPWLDFTGRSIAQELGHGWVEGVHPEDRKRRVDIYTQSFDRREKFRTEYRLRRYDGEFRWILDIGVPRFNADRSFAGYVGIGIDLTEGKLVEERLREYEQAVEGSEEMIAVVNREYRFLIANRKFLSYRNMSKEQVVGRLMPEVLNPGVFEASVKEKLDECFRGKVVRHEMKYKYPALGERDLFISDFPIEGPAGVDRVVSILQDVTERKQAEEALRRSEERFRLAAQAGNMFAYEWDAATDVIVRSAESTRILGLDNSAPLTGQETLTKVYPDDRERLLAAVSGLSPEHPQLEITYRILRPDGTLIWVERNSRAHFDEQGRMLRIVGMVTDITERKQAEQALRESEERLRLAAQIGKMYAYEWDVATDIAVRSEGYADIPGLSGEPRRFTRQELLARVHPDDRAKFVAAVADLTPQNPTNLVSYRVLGPDGAVTWVEKSGLAYFDEQGKMLRMVGMVADITQRKQAEDALQRSESNYRLFVSQSSEGIFCQELDRPIPVDTPEDEQVWRILHESYMEECNDALARMYGVPSPDIFLGKRLTETLDAEDPVNIELTRDFVRSGYRVLERESREADAEGNPKVFLNSMIGIVEDGMLRRTWGIQRDVTDRYQAEEARSRAEQALRESEERLRLAVQAGKMYAFEWNADTRVTVRSGEAANILNWIKDPHQDITEQFFAKVHPDDRKMYSGAETGVTPENPTYHVSYRMLRPDGSEIWLEEHGLAFFNPAGRLLRTIGIVADITAHKLAEEALSSVSRRLIEAQEKERARIARELHDDTNQRLSLLAIDLEQLKNDLPGSSDEAISRLDELRRKTLEISSDVQALAHELHSPKLDYLGLVAAMRSWCKEFGERQRTEIDFRSRDVPSSPQPEISLCLFRVLQEALHNAAKHSGVHHFEVDLWGGSGEIHLTVKDSGVGFDSQATNLGRGIGLTSMQERLKLVNGDLSIESQPRRGTTIHARVAISSNTDSDTAFA